MPRARYIGQDQRQTAAASENGSGCLSIYWLPPLAAMFIAFLLAAFALQRTKPNIRTDQQCAHSNFEFLHGCIRHK